MFQVLVGTQAVAAVVDHQLQHKALAVMVVEQQVVLIHLTLRLTH
jgi:hypothetical protein